MLKVSFLLRCATAINSRRRSRPRSGAADTGAAVFDKWVDPTAVSGSGCASADKLGFASSAGRDVPESYGHRHGVEFHRNGPTTMQSFTDWLTARPNAMLPTC